MMQIRNALAPMAAAALVLGLAACSKEPAEPAAQETGTALPQPAPSSAAATGPAVMPTAIPGALQGRWGLVDADCTSTRGDAKGLLTISGDTLTFYESVAKLATIRSGSPSSFDGEFAFTGEGQSWNLDVALTSPDGGKTLIRKDTGPDAMPGPLTYTKCP
ncbi:MAG: hypothetical protein E2586_11250 [Novosphingobium sp.]|uniref:hypothetical protein n=1 Tax=Novosphingobium sp. TaxID=1874826 RepID=UPI0012CFA6F4|nr:hypothetical protein [Novosphingobium sp.]MPS69062.1 hypothetical protein [Novosphingobium sp.]